MANVAGAHDRYEPPAECIRTARRHISEVMQSLKGASAKEVDRCADLLGDACAQLQSAAAMLSDLGPQWPDASKLRLEIEGLREELNTLASALAESDRLVSGWIRRMGAIRGGYTEQGASAPLTLVKKVHVVG